MRGTCVVSALQSFAFGGRIIKLCLGVSTLQHKTKHCRARYDSLEVSTGFLSRPSYHCITLPIKKAHDPVHTQVSPQRYGICASVCIRRILLTPKRAETSLVLAPMHRREPEDGTSKVESQSENPSK